ncbi:leucine-rich repeat domain-containing protein [Segatella copri]|uniref:leucine-rich repeat domain-containing protein n=1 Tax=Segatella copri TaxID=165179 RepID=UPI002FEFE734
MRNFTLRKGFLGSKCGTRSSFKGFVMLVVMMLMTASSAMAQEAKFEVIDGLRYLLDIGAKTATLMPKTDGNYSGDIVVHEKVMSSDGVEYRITSLSDDCFSKCSGLTSITIPSSVTSLGGRCFRDCSGLASIIIPSSVTSLGDDCFSGCRFLTSITIPSSVTTLGVSCFSGCSGLTSITIPSSVSFLGTACFEGCINIETYYFKGALPEMVLGGTGIPYTSIIKVPTEYLQDYKNAFGSSYKYIYAWNPDETGDDNKPVTQCSTPSISYESGKLKFACETAGAEYHYTITDTDITSDALSENGEVSLSAAYHISVYATADDYTASDKAEATLYWINANLDNGTNINQVRTLGVVASAHDGIISLSGLDDGEVVKFFAADGKYLGSAVAANGAASYAVSESLVIAKVGKDSIKIAMK